MVIFHSYVSLPEGRLYIDYILVYMCIYIYYILYIIYMYVYLYMVYMYSICTIYEKQLYMCTNLYTHVDQICIYVFMCEFMIMYECVNNTYVHVCKHSYLEWT